jgi:4-methylaminobutanoate oxidase (formaldehyde-forming)
LLARLCQDLPADNTMVRHIHIAYAPGMLVPWLRPSGLYLMTPTEFAPHVYERLVSVGDAFGLKHAGSLAAEGLAVGQGVPRFGTEIGPNIPAVAADIETLLDLQRNRGFVGRSAVLAARAKPSRKAIRAFTLEGTGPMLFANAPILDAQRLVGHVTSGVYVPSMGAAILLALVERQVDGQGYRLVLQGAERPLRPYRRLDGALGVGRRE